MNSQRLTHMPDTDALPSFKELIGFEETIFGHPRRAQIIILNNEKKTLCPVYKIQHVESVQQSGKIPIFKYSIE